MEDGWFTAAVVNNVLRCVRRLYGLPEYLFYDGDGIYTAGDVEKTLAGFGVEPLPSTSDAPWSNGIAEKHGDMLKLVLERFFEDYQGQNPTNLTFSDILEEALASKNETPGGADVAGLSPFELFLQQKPTSHPTAPDRLDVGPLDDELPKAHEEDMQVREALRASVNSMRSRRLIGEAIR